MKSDVSFEPRSVCLSFSLSVRFFLSVNTSCKLSLFAFHPRPDPHNFRCMHLLAGTSRSSHPVQKGLAAVLRVELDMYRIGNGRAQDQVYRNFKTAFSCMIDMISVAVICVTVLLDCKIVPAFSWNPS